MLFKILTNENSTGVYDITLKNKYDDKNINY